jgi:hypothetical protein
MKGQRAHLAARVADVDRAVLVAHMKERHPGLVTDRRQLWVVVSEHKNAHYMGWTDHYHEGVNRGPDERPPGWRTGEGAVVTR